MKKILLFFSILFAAQTAFAQDWKFSEYEVGTQYYIYNKGTDAFLNDDGTLTPYASTIWTINEDKSIKSTNGNYISVTSQRKLTQYSFTASASSTDSIALSNIDALPEGNPEYYLLGNNVLDKYKIIGQDESHVHYLTVTEEGGLCADSTSVNTGCGQWLFVKKSDYESGSAAKKLALEKLQKTIDDAQNTYDNEEIPGTVKAELWTRLTEAKALYKLATGILGGTVKYSTIVEMSETLQEKNDLALSLSDYYVAAKQSVENIENISSDLALRAATTTAKAALEAGVTIPVMQAAMTVLRGALIVYLRAATVSANTDLTGMITNPSFDTGDMTGWSNSTGDIGDRAFPKPVSQEEGIEGAAGRYFLNSEPLAQMILQPVIGLPAGEYTAKVNIGCDKGLLTSPSGHITAVTIPSSIFEGVDSITPAMVISKIGDILRDGSVKDGSVKGEKINILKEASVSFTLNENDILILGMTAGLTSLVSTTDFYADDVRLIYDNQSTPTCIKEANTLIGDCAPAYNIQGLPVNENYKGLIIKNGKKFIRK
ncbi:MAG: hypothetical protein HUK06_08475 [Bacteroidaceae bacterium]|nr:hypothetical protein [Bacteroidaceae bacterium]